MRIGKNMPVSAEWYGISFGSNRFVAISNNSNIAAYMEKGQEWVQTTLPAISKWQDIAFGNDTFIAVAKGTNKAAKSKDFGSTWTEITLADEMPWNDICFGDGKFVTIGGGQGDVCQHINYSSDNGDTWEMSELPCSDRWYKVCYGNNVFVALGNNSAAYSTDLVNWELTKMPADGAWRSVCYANGRFIALLSNTSIAAYSVDGITWLQTNLPSAKQWYSICYGNDRFFALSYESYAFSDDGIRWEEKGLDEYGYWYNICFGDGAFCSVSNGSDNVLYSFDGSHVYYYAHGELSLYEKIKLAGLEEGGGGTATVVEDTLDSTSTTNALSANQGKILNDELSNKVDKVDGKGLSTNDFTTEEKTKLAGIPEGGGATVVEDTLTSTSATNALSANQGKILNEALDNKVDKVEGKGLSTEDFTTEEKTKLANLGANISAVVEDTLTSTSTTNALSANMGKILNDTKCNSTFHDSGWSAKAKMSIGNTTGNIIYDDENSRYVMFSSSGRVAVSEDGETFKKTVDLETQSGYFWADMCYSGYPDYKYVAVGPSSSDTEIYIYTSTNLYDWEKVYSLKDSSSNLRGVCYGNGLYVAVGYPGIILTSPDCINWTKQTSGITTGLYSVCYDYDQFVAVGASGTIITSTDGITWTTQTSGTTEALFQVKYIEGKLVAVGGSGTAQAIILTSSDGTSWTTSYSNTTLGTYLTKVCGGSDRMHNTTLLAIGVNGDYQTILKSTDRGATWTVYNDIKQEIASICCVTQDHFITGFISSGYHNGIDSSLNSGATIFRSTDGINWNDVAPGLNGVCYGNGKYVAVGDAGAIFTSSDRINWETQTSGTTENLRSVCFGNNLFVAVGFSGGIFTSPDGITWTAQTASGATILLSVCFGNNMFVAVGENGAFTSTDGITWTAQNIGADLYGVCFGNGTFVAFNKNLSSSYAYTSSDGITWTKNSSSGYCSQDICFGNGQFVMVGDYGKGCTSPDGITWTKSSGLGSTYLKRVHYFNGQYIATKGYSPISYVSTDGITWTEQKLFSEFSVLDMCDHDGACVAVGSNVGTAYTGKRDISEVLNYLLSKARE